jgi:phosphate starvation-inducible PhoH-like protein
MASQKKPKKKNLELELEAEEILNSIEKNRKLSNFCNFRINNKFELNEVHNSFMQLLLYKDTKMIFVDGPAGSGKSYLSVYGALQMLAKRQINQIVYLRSIVESASKSIGSLPGELADKFQPWSLPLIEKLDELIGSKAGGELMGNGIIKCMPVNFVRGLTFRDSVVIVDEAQNLDLKESISILTRFGENTKYIVIGDSFQSDIGNKSGFRKIRDAFNNPESEEKGIHTFIFSENEVVRSQILRFIVKKLEGIQQIQ